MLLRRLRALSATPSSATLECPSAEPNLLSSSIENPGVSGERQESFRDFLVFLCTTKSPRHLPFVERLRCIVALHRPCHLFPVAVFPQFQMYLKTQRLVSAKYASSWTWNR